MKLIERSQSPFMEPCNSCAKRSADFFIALIPVVIWSVWMFGLRSLILIITSALSFGFFDFCLSYIIMKRISPPDAGMILRGVLFALLLPIDAPIVLIGFAALIASLIKWLIGYAARHGRVIDPLVGAYMLTFVIFRSSFAIKYTAWSKLSLSAKGLGAEAFPDPTALVLSGKVPEIAIKDLLIGNYFGYIGCVSTILIVAGFAYLVLRGRIKPWGSAAGVVVVGLFAYLSIQGNVPRTTNIYFNVCAGTLLFAFVFIMTLDGVSPVTNGGKIVFGLLAGAVVAAMRYFSLSSDAVMLSILILTPLSSLLDKLFTPKPFSKAMTL